MEWIGAWEMVVGPSPKSSIMEISSVGMGSTTPGITFATIGYPNSIKTMNFTGSNMESVCHSKFIPFIVSTALIMAATLRTSSITVTITWSMIPLLMKYSLVLHNAGLFRGSLQWFRPWSLPQLKHANMMIDNPFVGGCKVVVEIIGITENSLSFGNSMLARIRTIEGGCNWDTGGERINSLLT